MTFIHCQALFKKTTNKVAGAPLKGRRAMPPCHDNSRSVSFKCLSNFPFLSFSVISTLSAFHSPKWRKALKIQAFLFPCIPTDSTVFHIATRTTDQKAGCSNPSRRAKSPRNRLISRTFAFHKLPFSDTAFF